jgi:RNA polymerase sigma-B factor
METFAILHQNGPGQPESLALPAALADTADLADTSDADLLALVHSLPATSSRRSVACELLIERYRGLVRSCVNRYRRSPEPTEDLMQVGYLGLIKAINNFDPEFGRNLAAYAQPCITGELKRYFRDKRWQVHVERPVQERLLELRGVSRELTQRLGHQPSHAELAGAVGCTEAEVREAQQAGMMMQPASLDAPLAEERDAPTVADAVGGDDPGIERIEAMEAVAAHWGELPRREQRILMMRFYGDMTQADIGRSLGISQMHVSRLLTHALGHLRNRLTSPAAAATAAVAKGRVTGPASHSTPAQVSHAVAES